MDISFQDEKSLLTKSLKRQLKQLLLFCAKEEGVPEHAELSINIVDDHTIHQLNNDYRQVDEPTDVLAFPIHNDEIDEQYDRRMPLLLGDLVVSVERAKEQAKIYGHSFERELGFLIVHGFLHLLGYDHLTADDEAEMFERQEKLLKDFGLERS